MTASKIEWTDRSDWNPIRGCTRVSPGCGGPGPHGGCYAEAIAARFSDPGQAFHGFAERTSSGPRWTGKVEVQWDRLDLPLRWRVPAKIFASSTSDWFHEALPGHEIASLFAVAVAAVHLRHHTIQILMERVDPLARRSDDARATLDDYGPDKPPPRIWLGTSVEDRDRLRRVGELRETPAAVRFLSIEPLLEDLGEIDLAGIGLAIIGGESGPRARPMDIEWVRSIVGQCRAASVACFVKQLGANPFDSDRTASGRSKSLRLRDRKGGDMVEWPEDLRVREMPQ